jgi:hypothetical protein
MNDVVLVKGGVAVRHHRAPITGQRNIRLKGIPATNLVPSKSP